MTNSPTPSALDYQSLKDKILPVLAPYRVKRIAVFGSFVRGEATAESDIDILISLPPPTERPAIGLKWFDLVDHLSQILNRSVDLVTEEGLSQFIRPYVEAEMVVLYEAE